LRHKTASHFRGERAVATLILPTTGHVYVSGEVIRKKKKHVKRRLRRWGKQLEGKESDGNCEYKTQGSSSSGPAVATARGKKNK
jgi:hypothetical protein